MGIDLRLTPEELEEGSIQWHVSDILYYERKQKCVNRCREAGIDIEGRQVALTSTFTFDRMIEAFTGMILSALTYKAEADLAVVSIAAPQNARRYTDRVKNRVSFEAKFYTVCFREAVEECLHDLSGWHLDDLQIHLLAQSQLDKLLAGLGELQSRIPSMLPSPEVYESAKKLVKSQDEISREG